MSLDQPEENELLDRIAREDFADEWDQETHEDPYIDHGSPVGRLLTLCEIDGHTFGVIYRPDQGRDALRAIGVMASRHRFTRLGFGWKAAQEMSQQVVMEKQC